MITSAATRINPGSMKFAELSPTVCINPYVALPVALMVLFPVVIIVGSEKIPPITKSIPPITSPNDAKINTRCAVFPMSNHSLQNY